jgi:hypothetical protein
MKFLEFNKILLDTTTHNEASMKLLMNHPPKLKVGAIFEDDYRIITRTK